jgi:regulator of protease activity HflC (stomatin/prohibitin superfamily)
MPESTCAIFPFDYLNRHAAANAPARHPVDDAASHDGIQIGHIAIRTHEVSDSVLARLDTAGFHGRGES